MICCPLVALRPGWKQVDSSPKFRRLVSTFSRAGPRVLQCRVPPLPSLVSLGFTFDAFGGTPPLPSTRLPSGPLPSRACVPGPLVSGVRVPVGPGRCNWGSEELVETTHSASVVHGDVECNRRSPGVGVFRAGGVRTGFHASDREQIPGSVVSQNRGSGCLT